MLRHSSVPPYIRQSLEHVPALSPRDQLIMLVRVGVIIGGPDGTIGMLHTGRLAGGFVQARPELRPVSLLVSGVSTRKGQLIHGGAVLACGAVVLLAERDRTSNTGYRTQD